MTSFASVKAVLFDMDGLLLDTEPLYKEATDIVCARYDAVYTEEVKKKVVGAAELLGAQFIVDGCKLPMSAEEFLEARTVELEKLLPDCKPMPGAEKLSKHLKAKGIPIALATSSVQYAVDLKLRDHKEWFSIFDFIVTGDQVENGKPAPDIFLAAAAGLNIPATECLVFEDSPAGLRAGKAAGAQVVAVPSLDEPSLYASADLSLVSLEHFQPTAFGLPAYED